MLNLRLRRRRLRTALTAVATATALLALAACGGSGEEAGGTDTDAASSAASGAFPATVSTKFGDVTIAQAPQRIVALGWGDAETVLALGMQPVGASDWLGFGEENEGVGPWAQGMYDSPPTFIETLEPSYEAIGALEPDLILDTKSSGDQARYDALKEITPNVIGVPEGGDSYLTTREQQMELISTALGLKDDGNRLLDEIDTAFEDAAAAHREWEGQSVAAATRTAETWGAYIDGSDRVAFMENLGFVQSKEVAALPTAATGFSVNISSEQLDVLDADVIVAFPIFVETSQITDDPLWKQVPAVEAGHAVVIDGDLSQAYSLGTTLATTYAIEQLVPKIEAALGS